MEGQNSREWVKHVKLHISTAKLTKTKVVLGRWVLNFSIQPKNPAEGVFNGNMGKAHKMLCFEYQSVNKSLLFNLTGQC